MDWTVWTMFALTELALSATPGAAVLFVVSQGLRCGSTNALWSAVGILAANALYFAVSGTGVGALLFASGTLFTVVKWAGAAYLLYLRRNGPARSAAPPRNPRDRGAIRLRTPDTLSPRLRRTALESEGATLLRGHLAPVHRSGVNRSSFSSSFSGSLRWCWRSGCSPRTQPPRPERRGSGCSLASPRQPVGSVAPCLSVRPSAWRASSRSVSPQQSQPAPKKRRPLACPHFRAKRSSRLTRPVGSLRARARAEPHHRQRGHRCREPCSNSRRSPSG